MATIRRVGAGEGELLRTLRLAALLDAPSAFGSTHEEEAPRTDKDWAELAGRSADGPERATYFGFLCDAAIGIVGGHRSLPDLSLVDLVSLWIAPEARGHGIAALLIEAVLDWARPGGARRVELWVNEANLVAINVYQRSGFAPTGQQAPLRSDPAQHVIRLARSL